MNLALIIYVLILYHEIPPPKLQAPPPPPHRMMAPNFLPPRTFQFRKRQNHPHTLNSDGVAAGSSTVSALKCH